MRDYWSHLSEANCNGSFLFNSIYHFLEKPQVFHDFLRTNNKTDFKKTLVDNLIIFITVCFL